MELESHTKVCQQVESRLGDLTAFRNVLFEEDVFSCYELLWSEAEFVAYKEL